MTQKFRPYQRKMIETLTDADHRGTVIVPRHAGKTEFLQEITWSIGQLPLSRRSILRLKEHAEKHNVRIKTLWYKSNELYALHNNLNLKNWRYNDFRSAVKNGIVEVEGVMIEIHRKVRV